MASLILNLLAIVSVSSNKFVCETLSSGTSNSCSTFLCGRENSRTVLLSERTQNSKMRDINVNFEKCNFCYTYLIITDYKCYLFI
jgi:hypothetical protein